MHWRPQKKFKTYTFSHICFPLPCPPQSLLAASAHFFLLQPCGLLVIIGPHEQKATAIQQRHHLRNLTENMQDYFSWNTEVSTLLKNWGCPDVYTARMGFKIARSILCKRTGYSHTHPHAGSISIYLSFPASLLDSSWKLVSLFYLLLEETVIPNSAIVYFSCSNLILMN